jgi:NADH-quinone oxidoreductase subunit G
MTQTGARAALAVRQAVKGKAREMAAAQKVADWQIAAILNIGQRAKHPLFVTNVDDTRLDDIAAWTYRAPVEDQARLGFAIAHALDDSSPAVELDRDLQNKVDVIVQALAGAKKPLIISGTNAGSAEIIQAAANVAKALKGRGADVGVTMIARAVNSVGLGMIGGGSLEEALSELETGAADAVIVLENDLHRHASAARVDAALAKAPLVMVVDHQRTAIMDKAHLVLSAASFAESDGTVVNNEGRAQRFFQVYDPAYYDSNTVMLESWRWLHSLHSTVQSREVDWTQLDHVIDAVVKNCRSWRALKMPRLMQASAFAARNWRVNRTATAVVRRCAPTSACTNRVSRRIKTPCSPSPWKGTTSRLRRVRKFRSHGRRAGTPRRHGTSSRLKWAAPAPRRSGRASD